MQWFLELSPVAKMFVVYGICIIPFTLFMARFISVGMGSDFEEQARQEYLKKLKDEIKRIS